MMTGRGDQDLIDKAKPYGVTGYLSKPFTAATVKAHIEKVIGRLQ